MPTKVCPPALVTAAVLIAFACSSEKPTQVATKPPKAAPQPAAKSPADTGTQAPNTETPQAAIKPIGAPGPAYFSVEGAGLIKLDEAGKFSLISDDIEMIKDFAYARQTLYVASARGVYIVKNGTVKQVGDFKNPGLVDAIAAEENGNLWATSFKGVSHFDGKSWTTKGKKTLGPEVHLLADVAVSTDGTVWVASSNGLHKKNEKNFETVELPKSASPLYFRHFASSPRGALYVAHKNGVLKLDGKSVQSVDLPGLTQDVVQIGVGPDDAVHLATADAVAIARNGQVTNYSAESAHFKGKRILDLKVDGRGRTWAATDYGVVIIEPSGEVIQWEPGTISPLKGTVHLLTVIGAGPELPEVGPQKFGAVTGKIVTGGKPQPGVDVEICALPHREFTKTPCHGAPFSASAKTGPKGKYTFEKVPLGTYRFAIKTGDTWTVTLPDCCSKMKEGELFDVGTIDLSK